MSIWQPFPRRLGLRSLAPPGSDVKDLSTLAAMAVWSSIGFPPTGTVATWLKYHPRRSEICRPGAWAEIPMRQYTFLLRELVRRDFSSRYAGSALGFVWSFVTPLWQLALFTLVFSTFMKISPLGERTENFAVFLFCGMLPWMAFQEGVQRAATAITDNAALVKKLTFPAHVLVLTVVLTALLHEVIAAVVFLGVLGALGHVSWGTLPLLALAVPLQIALTLGLGLALCTFQVFFRDTAQVQGMVFMGWFYLTPIVYPIGIVPERYHPILEWNPMTALVTLYRQAILGDSLVPPPGTGLLAILALLLLALGGWLFRHFKPAFVDEL